MKTLKIAVGADHAGFGHKEELIKYLKENNYSVLDFGTNSDASCDYPDYAHAVAKSIEKKESDMGLLICGSGIGISIAANRHAGIRAALCWNATVAELARLHNDANVLALPGRFISVEEAKSILIRFLESKFEGGRHLNRIQKIELNS